MTGAEVDPEVLYRAGRAACPTGRTARRRRFLRDRLTPVLRWLTAGESHGPALVAILEGMPAHVRVTSADIAEALARRRLGFGRGARMKFEADEVTLVGGIRHGETQGGPVAIEIGNTEWPKWETVMAADPVDPACWRARPATPRCTGRDPGTPTWSGCRSTTSTRPGPSWSGPAPGRPPPGSPSAGWPRTSCARRTESPCSATSSNWAPSRSGGGADPDARRPGGHRRRPGPLLRPGDQRRHDRRGRSGPDRGRHPRRRRRGRGARPAAGARFARALGPPTRRPAGRRPDGHPGHQGGRGRRRLRPGAVPRQRRPRRDRARAPAASPAPRTAPAAPRAA